jgi:hypothetical protein
MISNDAILSPSSWGQRCSLESRARQRLMAEVRSGQLNAGFLFTIANLDRELAQLEIAPVKLMLESPRNTNWQNQRDSTCEI